MNRRTILVLALTIAIPAAAAVDAQTPQTEKTDPQALEFLKKVLETYGGEEGYQKSFDATMTAHHVAVTTQKDMRVEYDVTLVTRRDGASRIEKTVWGSKQVYASDGRNHWGLIENKVVDLDPKLIELLDLERRQRGIFLDHEKKGYVALFEAGIALGQRTTHRLRFQKKGTTAVEVKDLRPGDRFDFYFDPTTFLPVQATYRCPDPYGGDDFTLTVRFDDFADTQGIPYAKKITQLREGRPFVEVTVKRYEPGQKHPDQIFARPNPAD